MEPQEKRKRILVVENEPLIAKDVSMTLERLGYEVCGTVANYNDALLNAHQYKPQLALMDINIDGSKDGIQTAKALKAHYDIPVIFLTSLKDLDVIQKAKESEPFGYLVKPFRPDDLQTSIEIALYNHNKTQNLEGRFDKLATAIHVLDTAVIILDPEGMVDYINSRVEEMTGWQKNEMKGHSINKILNLEGLPAWLYLEKFSEKERLQNTFDFEKDSYLNDSSGSEVPVKGQLSSFHSTEGSIAGYLIVLSRAKDKNEKTASGEEVMDKMSGQVVDKHFFLKDKSSMYRIHLDDIGYVEALGNYVKVHTPDRTYTALITLKEIERILPDDNFFKIHRSYIVAINKITAIHSTGIQVFNNELPVGKTFRDDLMKQIKII